jgi:hypothetical protein
MGEAKRRRTAPKQRRKSGDASLEDRAGERVKPRKGNIMIGSDYRRNGREICWPFQTRVGELLAGVVGVIVMLVVLYVQHR